MVGTVGVGHNPLNDSENADEVERSRKRALSLPSWLAGRRRLVAAGLLAICSVAFLAFGVAGVYRYVETFWLYRGFPAPAELSTVVVGNGADARRVPVHHGTVVTIEVDSPAVGGHDVPVLVYLPPGYASNPRKHYPVFYLLHGFPGAPAQFIQVGDLASTSDTLIAKGEIEPMICVMPSNSTGSFVDNFLVDNEWANTIQPHGDWETFVARDLVSAIDSKFRVINRERSRAIGGLSEGAYAALNIDFHHVGEYGLVEGWSPYYVADKSPGLFGKSTALLNYNSPAVQLPLVARRLRATHTYIWLYDGSSEIYRGSKRFTAQLTSLHVDYNWSLYPGHHNWGIWRREMPNALITASDYFQHGAPNPT